MKDGAAQLINATAMFCFRPKRQQGSQEKRHPDLCIKMIVFHLITLVLIAAVSSASGQEFYRMPEGGEPVFLSPPNVDGDLEYEIMLNEKLLSRYGRGSLGTLLVLPALTPEYCVSIYEPSEVAQASVESGAVGRGEFVASAAKASRNLHAWIQGKKRGEYLSDVEVSYKYRKISRELAVAFQRLWARSILMTRYPQAVPPPVADGITFRFSVVMEIGEISGEARNAEKRVAWEMAMIGVRLFEYVMDEELDAEETESKLIEAIHTLDR